MKTEHIKMLESAAKAAGYKFDSTHPFEICIPHKGGGDNWYEWNPLEDDAQCLQLARTLKINIDYSTDKCAWVRTHKEVIQEYFDQGCEDWWKTDREAVVAVAAAIGKSMLQWDYK
jgi:hypothetical protein